ncbi:MAG: GNAT family N-acetyltransferase [Butyrivibrio sp.]|nr:GNAT family N-acetyltransferase [Butyrivibrio sp.]
MIDFVYDMAQQNDIEELIYLRLAYINDDFGNIEDGKKEQITKQLSKYYYEHLGKDLIVFTARTSERIVATAYLLIEEKPANPSFVNGLCGEVLSVVTLEEYRGRGICSTIMEILVDYCEDHDIKCVTLLATQDGCSIYKKCGFISTEDKYTYMSLHM